MSEPRTYLSHESVGAGALFVSENNLRIVVGLELGESGVLARNFALRKAAGPQRVLGHVGDVLHEDQRGEFPRRLVAVAAPAGPTSPQGARAQQQQQHAQANTDTHSITDHSSGRLRRPPAAAGAGAERRVEGDAPPPHSRPRSTCPQPGATLPMLHALSSGRSRTGALRCAASHALATAFSALLLTAAQIVWDNLFRAGLDAFILNILNL